MEEILFELYRIKGSALSKDDIDECENLPSYNTLCRKGYKLFELNSKFKHRLYEENPKSCIECGKDLAYTKDIEIRKFCNKSCSAKHSNVRRSAERSLQRKSEAQPTSTCIVCKSTVKSTNLYCGAACIARERYDKFIGEWLDGKQTGHVSRTYQLSKHVRRYLHETRGTACSGCGWDKRHPIDGSVLTEVDHIDGNASNCRPENLRILCPNCHSMTPTFRARNPDSVRRR